MFLPLNGTFCFSARARLLGRGLPLPAAMFVRWCLVLDGERGEKAGRRLGSVPLYLPARDWLPLLCAAYGNTT